jgi:hypothetical protein
MWDLEKKARIQIMLAPSNFKQAQYFTDESQILTCGADGKV